MQVFLHTPISLVVTSVCYIKMKKNLLLSAPLGGTLSPRGLTPRRISELSGAHIKHTNPRPPTIHFVAAWDN